MKRRTNYLEGVSTIVKRTANPFTIPKTILLCPKDICINKTNPTVVTDKSSIKYIKQGQASEATEYVFNFLSHTPQQKQKFIASCGKYFSDLIFNTEL